MVCGQLTRQNEEIEDFVIARADGTATYNFAVVLDDHDMSISHVIRGNDHVTNTFKQLHIYRALNWQPPVFGHLPLILRPDRKKVSKRLGDKDINEYRSDGIVPEAMLNYLCLLGWSPKADREIYSRNELVDIFTPNNFNASNAIFDIEKLFAINREHLRLKTDHDVATLVAPMLVDADLTTKYWLETRWDYLRAVIRLLRERVRVLSDFVEQGGYFFSFDYKYDTGAEKKHFRPEAADRIERLADRFERLAEFSAETTEDTLSELAEEIGVKRAQLIHPTRLAVSGVPAGPGLYELLTVLGQRIVVERMQKAVAYIRGKETKDQ
jgi:glutamyl-tRNA synthetase